MSSQDGCRWIGGVIDGVLAERHVAHRQIIEVLPVCLFKTGKGNIGVLIKLSGNAPGQIVQLYAVQLRRRQRIRQEAEKVADAHGRFQHGPRLEIHILHRLIHGFAIRLPNNAFKANAGTEVVSDIIFLQKRDRPAIEQPGWVQVGENEDGFKINS